MNAEQRIYACEGKDGLTSERAKIVARNMRQRGAAVSRYKCKYCGKWHVGGTSNMPKKGMN